MMMEQENNKTIEAQGRDWVEIVFEVIALTIIAAIVFIGGVLSFKRIMRLLPFLFANWFICISVPFLILGFDIIWVIGMKKWQPRSDQLKILKRILSVIVFAFSASMLIAVLGLLFLSYLFQHVW
jgi:hypothetical protein